MLYQQDTVDIVFNYSIPVQSRDSVSYIPVSRNIRRGSRVYTNVQPSYNRLPNQMSDRHQRLYQYDPRQTDPEFRYVIARRQPADSFNPGERMQPMVYKWQVGGITVCNAKCDGGKKYIISNVSLHKNKRFRVVFI